MKNFKLATLTTLIIMSLSGCADKEPTKGDFMRMHAQDEKEMSINQKAIAKKWDSGSEQKLSGEDMIKDGEKSIKDGQKTVKEGNKDITSGKQEIEQGNKDSIDGTIIMKENERIFREKYPDLKLVPNK